MICKNFCVYVKKCGIIDMVKRMKEFRDVKTTMYILLVVWLLSILFSAMMFTISLIYEEVVTIVISGFSGVFSVIGVFYTGNLIIKLQAHQDYIKSKAKI